jgi:hypothetical protein
VIGRDQPELVRFSGSRSASPRRLFMQSGDHADENRLTGVDCIRSANFILMFEIKEAM